MKPRSLKPRMATVGAVLSAAVVAGILGAAPTAAAAPPRPAAPPPAPAPVPSSAQDVVPAKDRDALLPRSWKTSADVAWTTSGDSDGFHLLMADARSGYAWRTVASVSEPGLETDQWVGNACVTGSGKRAVLVYAPRHFTNREHLFGRGGFGAVVDLTTGAVTKLDVGASLAYYDPGCGTGETAVVTQSAVTDLGRTRLHVVDAVTGKVARRHELTGQVTSAVPLGAGIVAASGPKLVDIAVDGKQRTLATTRGVPFHVHPDAAGGVTFLDQPDRATAAVNSFSRGKVRELGRGKLSEVGLTAGVGGRTFVTGDVKALASPPAGMTKLAVDAHAEVSTHGGLAVTRTGPVVSAATPDGSKPPVALKATVTATGKPVAFLTAAGGAPSPKAASGGQLSPVLKAGYAAAAAELKAAGAKAGRATGTTKAGGGVRLLAESPTNPVDNDRSCAVARNDVRTQIEQPHWRQVEWAADLAVSGNLTVTRPANWNGSGLSAWSPQGMFPRVGLTGGGKVPASIMLGILSQESNLWQASWHVAEGQVGNPLVGSYYGIRSGWNINWADADCGYGVSQVTDGMRDPSKPRWPGEQQKPANQQRAIAVDYATNIAAGLQILEAKWNQVYPWAKINNADPTRIENWFAAVWAYNSGINPQATTGNTTGCTPGPTCTDNRGNWGLGWGNNPANPDYPPNRRPFLNGVNGEGNQADAARPSNWPYPEKVLGWAAFPIVKYDFRTPGNYYPGYAQAWWTTNEFRTAVKPPLTTFCSTATATNNNCRVTNGTGACLYSDYHCWWHWAAQWKPNCQGTDTQGNVTYTCGYDSVTYAAGSPEPPDGTHYPPVCTTAGLPPGSLIVDDQPDSVPLVRSGCSTSTTNSGTFGLQFAADSRGLYPSKMDFHQIGGGLDGHFWFAHTHTEAQQTTQNSKVTGTWRLNQSWNRWGRVFVHLPGHGAHSQQAKYRISGLAGPDKFRVINTKSRYRDQSDRGDRWVNLGTFQFAGTPTVTLDNTTRDGTGTQDIAYDAVAFLPLSAKPRQFVVALGDSYSSGEGASEDQEVDYDKETNADGADRNARNGCHRSRNAWIHKAFLADQPDLSIGARAGRWDTTLDFQFIACSGAETRHLVQDGPSVFTGHEIAQLDSGFLDENTTLVTLSIGGNDARFGPVLQFCAQHEPALDCWAQKLGDDPDILLRYVPQMINEQVKPSIGAVLTQIHAKAPNAKIVLVGYPKLMANNSCLQGIQWPKDFRLDISISEVTWMNDVADVLATAMSEAVAPHAAYARFADPRQDFVGQGACSSNESIHGLILGQTPGEIPVVDRRFAGWGPSQQSFHPNIQGTDRYAVTVNRTLRAMGL